LNRALRIQNCQRSVALDSRAIRRITLALLEQSLSLRAFDLGLRFVGPRAMARANRQFLNHEGPTDVLTFNYLPAAQPPRQPRRNDGESHRVLQGEILICPQVAVIHARQFRTAWQQELVRYVVHGVLHLLGYNDARATDRRIMKREEDRLLRELQRTHNVRAIARPARRIPQG
jgi:probable rRNA maturation factor